MADRAGEIEVGRSADLVVLDGDPFADRGAIGARAAAVFGAGRRVVDRVGIG